MATFVLYNDIIVINMDSLIIFFIFIIGASIGSFLNVIIDRYNTGLPFMKGRSFCFSCNSNLKFWHMFPVLSFLLLKGKCAYCKEKIPKQTFVSELIMGFGAMFIYNVYLNNFFDHGILFPILLFIIFAHIVAISFYDLKHSIIPDSFLVSLILFIFINHLYVDNSLVSYLIAGLICSAPFAFIFFISRGKWLGFGDVKYVFCVGLLLGLPQGVSAVVLAFWIGAIFSILAISFKKIKIYLPFMSNNLTLKSEIPFGPFISIGVLISFYFNADIFFLNSIFNNF